MSAAASDARAADTALEDFQIDFTIDSGMHAKMIALMLQPFTLIGATKRTG